MSRAFGGIGSYDAKRGAPSSFPSFFLVRVRYHVGVPGFPGLSFLLEATKRRAREARRGEGSCHSPRSVHMGARAREKNAAREAGENHVLSRSREKRAKTRNQPHTFKWPFCCQLPTAPWTSPPCFVSCSSGLVWFEYPRLQVGTFGDMQDRGGCSSPLRVSNWLFEKAGDGGNGWLFSTS